MENYLPIKEAVEKFQGRDNEIMNQGTDRENGEGNSDARDVRAEGLTSKRAEK